MDIWVLIIRSVAEWFKAAVSKTAEVNSSEGSNPSRSAQKYVGKTFFETKFT